MEILIAEDDMTSRLVLGATLKKLGHEVTATSDGREAWDALNKEHFPLLISDWMMPDMDGLELCHLIRAADRPQYTYIILLTALGGKASYLDGMGTGTDDCIIKPFTGSRRATANRWAWCCWIWIISSASTIPTATLRVTPCSRKRRNA